MLFPPITKEIMMFFFIILVIEYGTSNLCSFDGSMG